MIEGNELTLKTKSDDVEFKDFFINKKYKPLFELLLLDEWEELEKKGELSEDLHQKLDLYRDIRYVVITGGRASAKSVGCGCFVNECTYENHNVLLTRFTMSSAKDSVIPEFEEKCEWLGDEDNFSFKETTVENNTNGSRVLFKGQKPSSKTANGALKSVNGISVFITEEAQEVDDYELWDKINKSIRTKGKRNLIVLILNPTDVNHWIYKEFFAKNAPKKSMTMFIHTTYLDNKKHLDKGFLKEAEIESKINPIRYNNIWLGKWASDTVGALWKQKLIQRWRILSRGKDYKRIVVSIDPAVTSNENSDEYGIFVCGEIEEECPIKKDGKIITRYHVLEDNSQILSPHEACELALSLFDFWEADKIIAEVNNGGDWIEELLRTIRPNVSYDSVRASRGKITRAEPISSLYEQGVVSHVGYFKELEFEQTTYTGDKKEKSPNRLDALVWCLAYLSQDIPTTAKSVSMPYF